MKQNNHSVRTISLTAAAGLMLAFGPALADGHQSKGYIYGADGKIARDSGGDCIRTIQWTFTNAVAACDPDAILSGLAAAPTETATSDMGLMIKYRVITRSLQGGQEFGFDDDKLTRRAQAVLNEISNLHQRVLFKRIDVLGHTDRIGDADYNRELSRRRGNSVKLQLMKMGVPEAVIAVIPVGSTDPIVACDDIKGAALRHCLAPNRRTEVRYRVPYLEGGIIADLVEKKSMGGAVGKKVTAAYFDVSNELNRLWRNMGNSCRAEMADLCGGTDPGDRKLFSCLYSNYSKISGGCRADLNAAQHYIRSTIGRARRISNVCATDMAVICKDVKFGSGGMLSCLKERPKLLANDCRQILTSYDIID